MSFGQERGPPLLERGELSPVLLQFPVNLLQLAARLPFPEVPLTMTASQPAGVRGSPATAEGELEKAITDHRDARPGLAPVVPRLPAAHQRVAVLGPGEVPLAQDLPEHRVHRVRVSGGEALQRQRAMVSDPR